MRYLIPMIAVFSFALLTGCAATSSTQAPAKSSCATCASGEYCAECAAKKGEKCAACNNGEMSAACTAKKAAAGEAPCAACAAGEAADAAEHTHQAVTAPTHATDAGEPVVIINAKGMGCPLCASSADRRLMKVDGVKWTNIDLGNGIVTVGLDPEKPAPAAQDLQAAIRDAGFTAEQVTMPDGEVTP